jgi:CubicO group peptidase (beta-lactamase class C family)
VEGQLLAPLGMTATGFDTSVAAPGGLATGHARLDGRWRAEPFSGPGVFSAMGGLFSTVGDLGTWVRWLAGAFPARDGDDTGPLPRALRREMQQARRAIPVKPRRDSDEGRVASGYGYGLVVENHERWGDVVSHSGGYPGFGSHIRWHPETGLGVIALANGRYAPCHRKAAAAMRALLSDLDAPVEAAELWPETIRAQAAVEGLLRSWDPAVAATWFAGNVEMDLDLAHRRAEIASLVDDVGPLLDSDTENELLRSDSAAHAEWRVPGTRGELRCEIQLTPQNPPRIQALTVARLEP